MRFHWPFLLFSLLTLFSCRKVDEGPVSLNNLVSKITFDNGNAYDIFTGIQGTVFNATVGEGHSGTTDKAMYFHRADSSYIDFGDDPAYSFPNNVFTIACWVLLSDSAQPVSILSKRNPTGPFEYSIDNHMDHTQYNCDNWIASGSTTVYGKDPLNAGVPLTINHWQHMAFVADGVFLKSYLNGELTGIADTIQQGNSFSDTDAPFHVGVGGGYGKHYFFEGAIDDIWIFKRALSNDEIMSLINL